MGVGAFVIGLSQISSFFSFKIYHCFIILFGCRRRHFIRIYKSVPFRRTKINVSVEFHKLCICKNFMAMNFQKNDTECTISFGTRSFPIINTFTQQQKKNNPVNLLQL